MKKSIFIGALALITLAACQNEREESTPKVEERAEMAINAVKIDSKDPSISNTGRPAQPEASIECHTSYFDNWGVACVRVNGQMYQVRWSPAQKEPGSNEPAQMSYSATAVSSCSCG
ncbi:hypothetical protein [Chryseobacterium sp. HR92]|uniref:hypothetical protein n=1 Tax=Chryseobacterium sp. HR92 TaxID=3094839 RepID=UPI00388DD529|nr:hypothetical protein SFA27_16875 [Chryseobacterium sp. HR92]